MEMSNSSFFEGLDLIRYDIINVYLQDENDKDKRANYVIIQRSKQDDVTPWCVQYRGSGHYFKTYYELVEYCKSKKFKCPGQPILT